MVLEEVHIMVQEDGHDCIDFYPPVKSAFRQKLDLIELHGTFYPLFLDV